ncbi:TRAP transporter small permease [Minwuia sp.]|uniref:TRAP transporter small permease n=1 Tax=Minwuia sp. TaxID=2493630 RepID=UPI003A8D6977
MIEKLLRMLARIFGLIGMVGMFAMLLHVTLDVAGKWLLGMPLPVTIEMTAHYYMVAVVFFPLAAVELRNGHISVEIISQYLKPRIRRMLVAIVSLLGVIYFAILTARTWHDAVNKYEIGEYLYGTVPLEIWQTRFFVPLGCGLLAIILFWKAVMVLRGAERLVHEGSETIELDGSR